MSALDEIFERLTASGMSEDDATALIARLLHEEAAGFLWCRDELMKQSACDEFAGGIDTGSITLS